MSSRVRHLRNPQDKTKTLCGREATYRYRFTDVDTARQNINWLSCDRCRAKAIRLGLLQAPPAPAAPAVVGSVAPRADSAGDKEMYDYFSRIGIFEYRT